MSLSNLAFSDVRREGRDEVHYRARGTAADGRALKLVLVNTSTGGFMARCEAALEAGDTIEISLPLIGKRRATIRWALGGRIGCEFDQPILLPRYYELLTELQKQQ
jgi:hypothetical protein